ncbi:hypothetical protein POMI540_4222 [Schizosaccharomyces pombe]|uniref:Uncharacterized protein C9E9.17c n=1 Tax=Schizosaccharomyces pombe (strain 972 / ATCC 24843) TaxID=284812 RepID=YF1H_SCHPO|nr:uncharacterized protein SPAC9E9.17c [Schizosaccharomyces pombe]Q9UT14.2 RecName: Full=Uncharacterized protein C9E9.17c; Flags: Precursor [Schizosaccharomyces pombe 972h-]CAB58229.2 dubious [Schizosaccharomyces pombe]|eukprot:NP_594575.2 uncharacterized protein SPAC9E9.17c [Schizosaccharomyces pombe]
MSLGLAIAVGIVLGVVASSLCNKNNHLNRSREFSVIQKDEELNVLEINFNDFYRTTLNVGELSMSTRKTNNC